MNRAMFAALLAVLCCGMAKAQWLTAPAMGRYAADEESATPPGDERSTADVATSAPLGQRAASPLAGAAAGPKPWTIPQPGFLEAMKFKLGGWIDQGYTYNDYRPLNGFNGPVGLNDLANEYQMNQLWLFLDRPCPIGEDGWHLGAHLDLVYGTDWRFGINHGLEDRINAFNGQTYGMVIPQAFLDIAYSDVRVRLGHFASPLLVYETVPAVANPLYSHSYAIAFSEPLLVTGVQVEWQLNKRLQLLAGFNRGWMMFEDNNTALDVFGGFRWKSDNGRTQLTYVASNGPQDPAGAHDRFSHVFLFRQKVGEKWEYIFQHDLGVELHAVSPTQNGEWYGITQYVLYNINPKWQGVARVEWFRDDDGVRVFGPPPQAGIRAWPGAPGFAGNFGELTLGLNWRPCPNIVARPEIRWDWYNGTRNSQGQLPFSDGTRSSQFLVACDVIFTF